MSQVVVEPDSLRLALEWALTSPALAEKGVELAGALFWFWTKRGLYDERKLWLDLRQREAPILHNPAPSLADAAAPRSSNQITPRWRSSL